MANPKKIIKGVKKLTNKQRTYQIRAAAEKREKELQANGGRASAAFIAKLRRDTFPEQYK